MSKISLSEFDFSSYEDQYPECPICGYSMDKVTVAYDAVYICGHCVMWECKDVFDGKYSYGTNASSERLNSFEMAIENLIEVKRQAKILKDKECNLKVLLDDYVQQKRVVKREAGNVLYTISPSYIEWCDSDSGHEWQGRKGYITVIIKE